MLKTYSFSSLETGVINDSCCMSVTLTASGMFTLNMYLLSNVELKLVPSCLSHMTFFSWYVLPFKCQSLHFVCCWKSVWMFVSIYFCWPKVMVCSLSKIHILVQSHSIYIYTQYPKLGKGLPSQWGYNFVHFW